MFASEPPWRMQYKMNFAGERISNGHRPTRPYKPSSRVPEGQVDPEELSRRLYVVLAEQKALAERKRRHRGEVPARKDVVAHLTSSRRREAARTKPAEPPTDSATDLGKTVSATSRNAPRTGGEATVPAAAQQEPYHHVPQEAAKQFTRTTTVDNMRDSSLVHKLSKNALKFHLDGGRQARPAGNTNNTNPNTNPQEPPAAIAPAELTRALQQTQAERERLLDRNQFQRTSALEDAARQDQHAPPAPKQQHTFQGELARILPRSNSTKHQNHSRRYSTGTTADILAHSSTADSNRVTTRGPGTGPNPNAYARHSYMAPDTLTMDTLLEDAALAQHPECLHHHQQQSQETTTTAADDNLTRFPPPDRARTDWTQRDSATAAASERQCSPPLLPQQPLNQPPLLSHNLPPHLLNPIHTLPLATLQLPLLPIPIQQQLDQLTKLTHPITRITRIRPSPPERFGTATQADVARPGLGGVVVGDGTTG
ncbi:uncharacterized protein C8A04DRAFT_37833 [Dichotomopilus funicola]|uniref:Uncharacterized protein n=1 Tax=Dichotomopilus funicola TaxID=1934379 RepID=A0AAN6ZMT6_9PEZI|nr:hypothetical protein C8A04DRAFT_37833 [Dichotomopilus funicola]